MFYKDKSKASYLIQSASNNIGETEIKVVQQEVKKKMANNHYENIPLEKNQWTGNYPAIHGTKAAIDCFSKTYAKFSLKRTIVNPLKEKLTKKIYFTGQKKGRAKPVDDEMLQNIRGVTIWSRLAGTVIF